jgi:hypothetical protein
MSAVASDQQFGAWTVALVDPTGKRSTVICQCGRCGLEKSRSLRRPVAVIFPARRGLTTAKARSV